MAEKKYIELREAKRVIKANGWQNPALPDVVNLILDMVPSADVAPVVHGEWIVTKTEHGWNCAEYPTEYTCSVCGRTEPQEEPYCHCGARMDGGTEKPYKPGINLLELQCKKFTETCEQVIEESVFMQKIREFKGDQT